MSIVEHYRTNRTMRERYFRMNGITHAEVCDSIDCSEYADESAYKIMLTGGDGVGCWENREFATIGQAVNWCREYAPELEIIC